MSESVDKVREYTEEEQALIDKYVEKIKVKPPRFNSVEKEDGILHAQTTEEDSPLFRAKMMEATGTAYLGLGQKFMSQIISVKSDKNTENPQITNDINNALWLMKGIKPIDEVESMLAVQMICTHDLAMEFLRKSTLPDRSPILVSEDINRATKLLRTYTAQMEALNRYRTKGQQKVTVEHVNVNAGGQAIVGVVERKAGG